MCFCSHSYCNITSGQIADVLRFVFSTGITGYIGGEGFYALHQVHPDWQYSALVRNKDKAAQVTSKFPNVRIVLGDLGSADIIEEEVKNADIVFRE
jgi:uncharacterized protein YbjT (DUF2867 family)